MTSPLNIGEKAPDIECVMQTNNVGFHASKTCKIYVERLLFLQLIEILIETGCIFSSFASKLEGIGRLITGASSFEKMY